MNLGCRADSLARLAANGDPWDVLVVGGGITGAGIVREAARRGLRAALIEQGDFASGTSSRSSKMVHGGLRYLGQGAFGLTRSALRERERLLAEAPGLVERMPVAFVLRRGKFPGRRVFGLLLALYDRMAGIDDHRFLNVETLREREPGIATGALAGAYHYTDALTDDARLVLRVLGEAVADGAAIAGYLRATGLMREGGRVCGVTADDVSDPGTAAAELRIRARVVVNATGAWADDLREEVAGERRIRPLRGSHLIVPRDRLPVTDAVTLFHPLDGRPVYAYPWLGSTVIGTTDLDHDGPPAEEPSITPGEVEYLLAAVAHQFPEADVREVDVVSTLAGLRPVIRSSKQKDPSKEKREEAIWSDEGLLTVAGGKLTTFRPMALHALKRINEDAEAALPRLAPLDDRPVFTHHARDTAGGTELAGRFGSGVEDLLETAAAGELDPLPGVPYRRAELRYALQREQVVHLDDLLLRRTRIGNLLPYGGKAILPDILALCRELAGWDEARAGRERDRYMEIVDSRYSLPR